MHQKKKVGEEREEENRLPFFLRFPHPFYPLFICVHFQSFSQKAFFFFIMMLRTIQRRFIQNVAAGSSPKILVTGSLGQVGCAQVGSLRECYGVDNVISSDVVMPTTQYRDGPFMYADVTDYSTLAMITVDNDVNWVVHNSSVQSMHAESDPGKSMDVTITGIRNILELAKNLDLRVFVPSSMAVFSPESGLDQTPDMYVAFSSLYMKLFYMDFVLT